RSMHPEIAVENAALVSGTDGAGAGGMMPPGILCDEAFQIRLPDDIIAGRRLLGDQPLLFQLRRHPPHEFDPGDYRCEIAAPAVAALAEVVEVDIGDVARIG